MTDSARERRRISGGILIISLAAWAMMLGGQDGGGLAYCPMPHTDGSAHSLQMLLAMNPPASLLTGWFIMLIAMMSPTLIPAIYHVRERSFTSRRPRAIALFAFGYTTMWMLAGLIILAAQLTLSVMAPQSYAAIMITLLITVIWQCSPMKQRCLNRHHDHGELRAFGRGADLDALRFGIRHGYWCIGSCWALMFLPMLLSQGHIAAMIIVTLIMLSESLEVPAPPRWRLRGQGKLTRILANRIGFHLRAKASAAS